MFLVTIWLWCEERWETGIQRWHVAPGLSHGCTLCNNCNHALLSWSWTAPASSCCSHFCLAPWRGAPPCSRSHTAVVHGSCVCCAVQNLWKVVARNGAGMPGLSCVSLKFITGFVHPWAKQCSRHWASEPAGPCWWCREGWVESRAKDWPRGTVTMSVQLLHFPAKAAFVSRCLAWKLL